MMSLVDLRSGTTDATCPPRSRGLARASRTREQARGYAKTDRNASPRRIGTSRAARPGFTLLELTIAMAIAATISLVLYSTFTTAYRARRSAIAQTASMREAAIALDLIEADLENATPPGGTYFGPMIGEHVGSDATAADTISFFTLGRDTHTTVAAAAGITAGRSSFGSSGPQDDPLAEGVRNVVFSIAADAKSGKNVLTRSVQRNVLPSGAAEFEDESLAGDVTALAFRYYDGEQWLDQWNSDDEDNNLPLAIEAAIDITGDDGRGGTKVYHMTRIVPLACASATALATRGAN